MKKKLTTILICFFLIMTLTGCNTVAGMTKGIVEDIRDIVPII